MRDAVAGPPAFSEGIKIRVLPGSSEKPITDVDRFLSMIQFDSREKARDLVDIGGN
jgi:hypothetical protein